MFAVGLFCNFSALTVTTEPVTSDFFFAAPYPTTTTSSKASAAEAVSEALAVLFAAMVTSF